ncbi:ABC transporter ATP-binding protein [Bailinhaonella thermotolerans]|uniref:ATP-binding cassette domain-containing protein n=1 Tax=Bailinhaonella thermotolerans TaxID=1070861 RepID=A0A3A4BAJ8_9ACTN|nr:ATP-binding cassette domain-containing protein [Bailinhaonella thermotolerans]RJL31218.1 ATP-binding cassette domain-containing protein [Bailinhaonella thermotolerans]
MLENPPNLGSPPSGSPSGPALDLAGVSVRVTGRTLLHEITWRVEYGEHWVVLGGNGAGKTTLLSVASAVRHPSSGTAEVLGRRLGRVDLRELRSHIGLVAASQRLVDEELLEGEGATAHTVVLTGHTGTSLPLWDRYDDAARDRARRLLADLGCAALAERPFRVLSQGERARVRVARALMPDPALLLLDEPFAGLDLPAREDLLDSLQALPGSRPDLTTITVTHHLEEVPSTTTHALLLRGGRVLAAGKAHETITDEGLSACFGRPLRVHHLDGRWHVQSLRASS